MSRTTVVFLHNYRVRVPESSARRRAIPAAENSVGPNLPSLNRCSQLYSEDGNREKVAQSLPNGKPLQRKGLVQPLDPQGCNSFPPG